MRSPDYLRLVSVEKRRHAILRDRLIRLATQTGAIKPLLRILQAISLTPREENPRISSHENLHDASRVLVYAHFDPEGVISEADRYMISEFRGLGYAILVVSTAVDTDQQHDALWASIHESIDGLITRPNVGFDFGSWSTGLGVLRLKERAIEQVVLLNNSVYGPMRQLAPILQEVSECGDVFGFVASAEFKRHLPSVFLGFHSGVIHSKAFETFWSSYPVGSWKNITILRAELMLSDYFAKAGFETGCLFQSTACFARNPHTFLYRELITHGFPFLKKSLFLRNYDDIDMSQWSEALGIESRLLDLITADVHRLRRAAKLD